MGAKRSVDLRVVLEQVKVMQNVLAMGPASKQKPAGKQSRKQMQVFGA